MGLADGLVGQAEGLLGALRSGRLEADEALGVLGSLSRLGRVVSAAQVLVARRVEELGAYRGSGHRSTAQLLAVRSGTSLARATEVVETAKRLGSCPRTEEALVSGAVSVEQAHAIARAVEAVPSAEGDLLALAGTGSLRTLQDKARDLRLEADDDRLGRYRRQHAARSLVHGRDDEGMVWGRFRLPPDLGAAVVTRLEHQADTEYRRGYREGRREAHDRHLADALVTLLTAGPTPSAGEDVADGQADPARTHARTVRAAPRADVVVHVSHQALRRGSLEPGETCMVPGAGPIPLERARELLEDAFLKGVLVDGTRVEAVRHFGRRIPAELRTALEVRSILEHGDVTCSVPGCDRRAGLEWDHHDPHANGGPTSYQNLQPLCAPTTTTRPTATGHDPTAGAPDPPGRARVRTRPDPRDPPPSTRVSLPSLSGGEHTRDAAR
ncbi:MAG: HNH endonuclease [Acidimicrobiia bacterium]|nr:HNH endonuclease [Acidimicrobiia bacterium]